MPEQLTFKFPTWVQRRELRSFIRLLEAAEASGHIHEAPYDYATSFPHRVVHREHGPCLAWMQRAHRECLYCDLARCACKDGQASYCYSRVRSPELCNVFRLVVTDHMGMVVDESGWCTTTGGVRGYRNRLRASTDKQR